ncbi:MAG TPA: hypothetical protein VF957_23420 [Bradyrhizobium sp.]
MSAFVCGNSHITALAVYAYRHGISKIPVELLGSEFLSENLKSVNHLYAARHGTQLGTFELCGAITFQRFSAVQIIKAAECLAYQSCEHPGYETSTAYAITAAIQIHALNAFPGWRRPVDELPGYDRARWHIAADAAWSRCA